MQLLSLTGQQSGTPQHSTKCAVLCAVLYDRMYEELNFKCCEELCNCCTVWTFIKTHAKNDQSSPPHVKIARNRQKKAFRDRARFKSQPWFNHGSLMVHWWFIYGSLMVHWWFNHGSTLVHWWFIDGSFMVHLWFIYGSFMVHLWFNHGSFVVHSWFICGSFVVQSWFMYGSSITPGWSNDNFMVKQQKVDKFMIFIGSSFGFLDSMVHVRVTSMK